MSEGPLADAGPGGQAVIAGEPVVNTPTDTAAGDFAGRSGETAEAPRKSASNVGPVPGRCPHRAALSAGWWQAVKKIAADVNHHKTVPRHRE